MQLKTMTAHLLKLFFSVLPINGMEKVKWGDLDIFRGCVLQPCFPCCQQILAPLLSSPEISSLKPPPVVSQNVPRISNLIFTERMYKKYKFAGYTESTLLSEADLALFWALQTWNLMEKTWDQPTSLITKLFFGTTWYLLVSWKLVVRKASFRSVPVQRPLCPRVRDIIRQWMTQLAKEKS